jgi:hypothetical protein
MEHATPDSESASHILWHPAFVEALKLELEPYRDALEFYPEYQLTSGPLQIDVVIIKKTKDVVIDKNIAAIFKTDNLIEFKSPGDYIAVEDFYKVYGYACLYAHLRKVPITGITLTFVGSRHPRELLKHLRGVRGYAVEEKAAGIYTINGDILPIQVIDSRELGEEENLWLRGLSDRLDARSIGLVAAEVERRGKGALPGAYFAAIMQANWKSFEEVIKMSNGAVQIERILREAGFYARAEARGVAIGEARGEARGVAIGEARGEARGVAMGEARGKEYQAVRIAKNLLSKGFTLEQTAELTDLDIEKVRALQQ